MTKKKSENAVQNGIDRSCRESSSEGSVFENPINGVTKNKSRKCKVEGSNKTATILKIRTTPRAKRTSESSCDSMVKEESNSTKETEQVNVDDSNLSNPQKSLDEKNVINPQKSSDEKNVTTPQKSSDEKNVTNPQKSSDEKKLTNPEKSLNDKKLTNPEKSSNDKKLTNPEKSSNDKKLANPENSSNDKKLANPENSSDEKNLTSSQKSSDEKNQTNPENSLDEKNLTNPHNTPDEPVEKNSEVPIPEKKDTLIKINSDKYTELMNLLNGQESEIDSFIKQYSAWQQKRANSGKQPKAKRNSTKTPTQQKPKSTKATPSVKLKSPKRKNKDTNKKCSVPNKNGLKKPDSSSSENKANIAEISSPVTTMDANTDIKNDSDAPVVHSSDTKTDDKKSNEKTVNVTDCLKDVHTDVKFYHLKEKSKSSKSNNSGAAKRGRRKVEELPKCLSPIDNDVKASDTHVEEKGCDELNNTKSDSVDSKEVLIPVKEDLHTALEFVSEGESSRENEGINSVDLEKNDLILKDSDDSLPAKIIENNDINSNESSYETKENDELDKPFDEQSDLIIKDALNDLSHNHISNQPFIDKSLSSELNSTPPCLKSKSRIYSPLSDIENNIFDESTHSDYGNKDKDILYMTCSTLNEGDSETDTVWKRKRKLSHDKSDTYKKRKHVLDLSETKSDEPQRDITSSEPSNNKWNTEEANSFSEELIYSDEEKVNSLINADDISPKVSLSIGALKFRENSNHKLKNISKPDLDKNIIEKTKSIKNNISHDADDDRHKRSKESTTTERESTPKRNIYREWKERKNGSVSDNSRSKHSLKDIDKVNKISSKSKKQMKSKSRSKSKKSSSYDKSDKESLKDKYENAFEAMLKKVREHGPRRILETDLLVVPVTYKGESLHGILGSTHMEDYLARYQIQKEKYSNENILSSSHAQGILKRFLRPLCYEMLTEGSCKDSQHCRKEHSISKDFFSSMDKHDAWLIVAFILRISNCLTENLLLAILEFLSKHGAKRKILLVSRQMFQSLQNKFTIPKSCWEDILIALECCGLQRWEGIKSVIQFIIDTLSYLKGEIFNQLLKIWNVHGSSFSNTWPIVEPLVTGKIITLQPLILSKLIAEIITIEPKDKSNIYRLLAQQLTSLTKDSFNQISYRLLNDFLRKVAQEGLHNEEKALREIMNASYSSSFFPQQSPVLSKPSSLRRCRSMINLANINPDSKYQLNTIVHEEEKMEAAIQRALLCSNFDSVIKVLIASSKKVFINKVLFVFYKFSLEKNPYILLKNILVKLRTNYAQYVDEIKDLIGNIVVTLMLDYVVKYDWKQANNYFNLLEENHINKYKLKSLCDGTLRPVRLAVTYSEVHYYNGRYKEAIGVLINLRLIDPDPEQWVVPGGNHEDMDIINVMVTFLIDGLIKMKITNIATMLFKAILEVQTSLNAPIDIGCYFEKLLYQLFELTKEYPETAVKLYIRVSAKDSNLTLYGLTYRALLILAYRTHKHVIIKDIFYKAINEYVYPIIELNKDVITLLRSHTEEEIIVYISEWVAKFKENETGSFDHKILIKFKDAVLEDFLDNKVLGIPALLKEVDQTLPGASKRLESVLNRFHLKFKQIKKDTFSIDPLSFQTFLNKIKVH